MTKHYNTNPILENETQLGHPQETGGYLISYPDVCKFLSREA